MSVQSSSSDFEDYYDDDTMRGDRSPILDRSEPPADRFRMVQWIMVILGIGTLLPWNMFITATDYFDYKFKKVLDESNNNTVIAPGHFRCIYENMFSVSAMVPNLVFVILNVRYAHRFSLKWRINVSLFILLVVFVFTTTLIYPSTFHWQNSFFAITIVCIAIMSAIGATFQAACYGLGGILNDQKYTGAIMSGQGMAGIFASIASILSIAGGSKPEDSALGYFLSAVAITAVCLVSFFVLLRLSYVRYYMTIQKFSLDHTSSSSHSHQQRTPQFSAIFRKIWMVGLDVFLTFFVTLAIYPGVSSNVKSVDAPPTTTPTTAADATWTVTYFTPLTCFLLFNFGDFVGRTSAPWMPVVSHRVLWIPVILRLAFLPLFALCNVHPRMNSAPVVFNSDIYPIVFMTLMAVSNGYLGTLGMMYGPSLVLTHEKETAGVMMSFFLTSGLAAGSAFSFLITEGLSGFAGETC